MNLLWLGNLDLLRLVCILPAFVLRKISINKFGETVKNQVDIVFVHPKGRENNFEQTKTVFFFCLVLFIEKVSLWFNGVPFTKKCKYFTARYYTVNNLISYMYLFNLKLCLSLNWWCRYKLQASYKLKNTNYNNKLVKQSHFGKWAFNG